jgi:cytochrome c oxidase subunit 2
MNLFKRPTGISRKARALEWLARGAALVVLSGLPLAIWLAAPRGGPPGGRTVEIHARMPELGGWSVTELTATAGQPLQLRLISDDVVHGFKIGQSDEAEIELLPGKPVETRLIFDQPGKYTYYCTRWCGPNHWRMRGTIEVLPVAGAAAGSGAATAIAGQQGPPLYMRLGLDIDAPHPAQATPQARPSAERGEALADDLPPAYRSQTFYRTHSPAQAWEMLRGDPFTQALDDQQVWDLVALIWSSQVSAAGREAGRALYAQNCAACHGENGAGDGVYAAGMASKSEGGPGEADMAGHSQQAPADFSNAANLLGASPALLEGKIVRGGMGTGMPYWGPIFSEEQIWALVDVLYATQFDLEVNP